ncbi:ATP-binding protein [Psychrobacter sp. CAL346-MNA-CIBAN-0220]|uniref:two-component system sensor histidine kinase NtrB n=1 Tax=Psychrobacter sp. CAL346-MNA-CIBAN-0220 TaxID=3140457 RepID=UPI00332CEE5E
MTHSILAEPTPNLAFISQHLFTAILWVDDTLRITWLNAQAEQILAISRGRLLQQSILTLLAPEELSEVNSVTESVTLCDSNQNKTCTLAERFAQAQHYQQPFIDYDHMINPQLSSGAPVLVDYSVTPVIYEQQSYFIIEMWGKDRQSRISEEQRQQQQYSVARHMLRSVAHEVKNPLAGIRGAAQLLQRQFSKFSNLTAHKKPSTIIEPNVQKTAQKLRTYTDIIISETDRLTQLIGQLLGSAELPHWQALNIHEPLEHVLTLVGSHYPQIIIQRDYDLSLPELNADKDQLIQVFLNLINNACEAMTEHQQEQQKYLSKSTISQSKSAQTDNHYQPQLRIQTRVAFQHTIGKQQHKQVLQITITDNGPGIDPMLIEQIFFPMVTSRAAGTGLGLAIVQDIISRHHGMIDVSSLRGQTRFTVYLPFTQPAPTSSNSSILSKR